MRWPPTSRFGNLDSRALLLHHDHPMVSVCVAVWKVHGAPNVSTLARDLPAALGDHEGELVVALNGVAAARVGVPATATVVDLGVNRGVSKGWNRAAAAASGDVLVFANDDIVLGPGAVSQLCDALLSLPGAGVVGVEAAALATHAPHAGRGPAATPCAAIVGHLFAVRRETFATVGGFDEAYTPCLWEELDFCAAVRDAGLEIYALSGISCAHRPRTSARRSWPWARVAFEGGSESLWSIRRRNQRRFAAKWPHGARSC
jgi:GT2 family glycosyltransferase